MTNKEQMKTRVAYWESYRQDIILRFSVKAPTLEKEKEKKVVTLKPVKESVHVNKLLGEYEKTQAAHKQINEVNDKRPMRIVLTFLIIIIVFVIISAIFFFTR